MVEKDGRWSTNVLKTLSTSRVMGTVSNLPPISWIVKSATRRVVREQLRKAADEAQRATPELERLVGLDFNSTLKQIVIDMVHSLGYVGAMVATYEQGDCLLVRAHYVDPKIASESRIAEWERRLSEATGIELSLSNASVARVYRYQKRDQENLSIRAVEAYQPVISDSLYSLFVPVVPSFARPVVQVIQEELGITQVMAAPFFVPNQKEPVGNLFVAKRGAITEHDKQILAAVCHQAAQALESERRRIEVEIMQDMVLAIQRNLQDETKILAYIVRGVVERLGFVGAMVNTYEPDGSLPVQAYHIDSQVASSQLINTWQDQFSSLIGQQVSLSNQLVARVSVKKPEHAANLSIQAIQAQKAVTSDSLFDLLFPIVPDTVSVRTLSAKIQEALGIRQLIAVPFFSLNETGEKELLGNLLAATRSRQFTDGEIRLLTTFGQQAAVGIQNARLYRLSEERREIAQLFSKMAFSATAYIHEMRNHITFARINVQMLSLVDTFPPERQGEIRAITPRVLERLGTATTILEKLHEPWQQSPDMPVDVNMCITRAIEKVQRDHATDRVQLLQELSDALPPVFTSHDMLTEAFRVLIRNAYDAVLSSRPTQPIVTVNSFYDAESQTVRVRIQDNGDSIKPENLPRIFDMRWSERPNTTRFGMFWSKEYIDNLAGRIEIISNADVGSLFEIVLPIHRDERSNGSH